jgi:DNA-binding SARP family transcriptional activator
MLSTYTAKFALDFEYEEWTSPFREDLHTAFLDVVEQTMHREISRGEFDRAAAIARAAIRVDPDAGPVEGALLQVYRSTGSYSAAAEQAARYNLTTVEDEEAAGW